MSQDKLLWYIVTFLSLIAILSFLLSPFFQIHEIQFNGIKILTKDELFKKVKSFYHYNLILLDKSEIKSRLAYNDYIKKIEITKKYPDKIILNITERIPLAKINNNGEYISFDEEGYILERGAIKTRVSVPEIKGYGYTLINNKIGFSPGLTEIVKGLQQLSLSSREKLKTIESKEASLEIVLNSRKKVFFGSREYREKFKVLDSILRKITEENLNVEYIDLKILQKPVIKLKK